MINKATRRSQRNGKINENYPLIKRLLKSAPHANKDAFSFYQAYLDKDCPQGMVIAFDSESKSAKHMLARISAVLCLLTNLHNLQLGSFNYNTQEIDYFTLLRVAEVLRETERHYNQRKDRNLSQRFKRAVKTLKSLGLVRFDEQDKSRFNSTTNKSVSEALFFYARVSAEKLITSAHYATELIQKKLARYAKQAQAQVTAAKFQLRELSRIVPNSTSELQAQVSTRLRLERIIRLHAEET